MTVEAEGDWIGMAGHSLALEFTGPSLAASLSRAVEGFADATADVHPSMVTERRRFEATGSTPSALLLAVLEECLRCRRDGRLAVALADAEVTGDVVRGAIDTVAADHLHGQARRAPVLHWQEVTLEPAPGGGWAGRIVAR